MSHLSDRLFESPTWYGGAGSAGGDLKRSPEITLAPVLEPVTVTEAKNQVGIPNVDEADVTTLLTRYIKAAREEAERWCNRAFITQTLKATFRLPATYIELPRPLYQSLVDTDPIIRIYEGSPTVLTTANYYVEPGEPAVVRIAGGGVLDATADAFLTVEYKCGYGTATSAVPEAIRQAILLAVADYYVNRQEHVTGTIVARMPRNSRTLLEPFKIHTI